MDYGVMQNNDKILNHEVHLYFFPPVCLCHVLIRIRGSQNAPHSPFYTGDSRD